MSAVFRPHQPSLNTNAESNYLPTRRDNKRLPGSRADGDEGSSSVQLVNQEGHEEMGNPKGKAHSF